MPERFADRLPGVGIPEPCRVVLAARQDRLAVGAEGRGPDTARMIETFPGGMEPGLPAPQVRPDDVSQVVGTRGASRTSRSACPSQSIPSSNFSFPKRSRARSKARRAACIWGESFTSGPDPLRVGPLALGFLQGVGHGRVEPGVPEEPHGDDRDHGDQQQRRRPGHHPGLVPPGPPRQPLVPPLAIRRDRLVGQPVLEVLGQGARRGVSVLRLRAIALRQIASRRAGGGRPADRPERRERAAPRSPAGRLRRPGRRTATGRSGGSRASPPGCRRRWPGRPRSSGPPPAPGSCTPACPAPCRSP